MNGNQSDYVYKRYVENLASHTTFVTSGTVTFTHPDDPETILIDEDATFISDGVRVGDIVSNSTDAGAAAAVVSVDSETQLTTAAIAGGVINEWRDGDDYSIAPTSAVVRIVFHKPLSFPRILTAFSNAATGSLLRIFYGNNQDGASPTFSARFTQNVLFQLEPDLKEAVDEVVIIEIASGGTASLSASFEWR